MHKGMTVVAAVALLAIAAVVGATTLGPGSGTASSHREAPLISEDPSADNTDLYAFRSPDRPDTVTIVSNWIPGEDPAAGPNYFTFSPSARYNIYIDRTGDARPDITYRFRFDRTAGPLFLGNTVQKYTVTRNGKLYARGTTPPNNIGPRATPNYRQLAAKGVVSVGGARIFAGQRDDPFFGDIGSIFDLLAIRKGTGNMGGGKDFFAGYAVHTIALQIPISQLDARNNTIGIWSSTDRQNVTVSGKVNRGWTQVSRIGNPLVNEVVVPTPFKDVWNRSAPVNDKQFAGPVLTPVLAKLMNDLYKVNAPTTNRDDLVAVFGTGVQGLNFTGSDRGGHAAAELLHPRHAGEPDEPAGRHRRRQRWVPERPPPGRRRHRRRRAGHGRIPQGEQGAARRRRQRRRPRAALVVPVRRGSAERIREHEGQVARRTSSREPVLAGSREPLAVSARIRTREASRSRCCWPSSRCWVLPTAPPRIPSATSPSIATRESRSPAARCTSATRSTSRRSRRTSSAPR